MTQDQIDTARLALNEAKVLAGLLSEGILNAGYVTTRAEHDRAAVLSLKVVQALTACETAMETSSEITATA
jgi:hypothetical protein